jgi:hypothetical protein
MENLLENDIMHLRLFSERFSHSSLLSPTRAALVDHPRDVTNHITIQNEVIGALSTSKSDHNLLSGVKR